LSSSELFDLRLDFLQCLGGINSIGSVTPAKWGGEQHNTNSNQHSKYEYSTKGHPSWEILALISSALAKIGLQSKWKNGGALARYTVTKQRKTKREGIAFCGRRAPPLVHYLATSPTQAPWGAPLLSE
jgi:hypothetical protein